MRNILILLAFVISTVVSATASAENLSMTTNAFLDEGAIPVLYTCDGKDVSPALSWSNAPANTKSFVLIVSDPDAPSGTFYHWVIYNIPKSIKELKEGVNPLPSGTLAGKNGWGKAVYSGPCPPKGSSHTYLFTLYALSGVLSLPPGADAKTVISAIHSQIIQQTKLTAVYSRWAI